MHPVYTLALQTRKPATTSASVRLPLTFADLERWFSTADAASIIVYHRGFLALDRGAGSRLGEGAGEELDHVATAVLSMAEAGRIHLVQRRHGAFDYSYLALMARSTGARRFA